MRSPASSATVLRFVQGSCHLDTELESSNDTEIQSTIRGGDQKPVARLRQPKEASPRLLAPAFIGLLSYVSLPQRYITPQMFFLSPSSRRRCLATVAKHTFPLSLSRDSTRLSTLGSPLSSSNLTLDVSWPPSTSPFDSSHYY